MRTQALPSRIAVAEVMVVHRTPQRTHAAHDRCVLGVRVLRTLFTNISAFFKFAQRVIKAPRRLLIVARHARRAIGNGQITRHVLKVEQAVFCIFAGAGIACRTRVVNHALHGALGMKHVKHLSQRPISRIDILRVRRLFGCKPRKPKFQQYCGSVFDVAVKHLHGGRESHAISVVQVQRPRRKPRTAQIHAALR